MSELTLKNVCKKYKDGFNAVKSFDLNIKDKEFIIFVGPSGCGKSTTLRMIAGLEEISEGELWIDDILSNYVEPKDRELSMVFQNYALYPNMNVYDNIAFSLKVRKVPKAEIDKKVHEVAKILEIEHLLKNSSKDLSGGQKQRVAIGNAIIRKPKALLMDEPLSNLDAKLRNQMRVELKKLHQTLDTTIIYVTHDQTEAMTLGSRIVVMKDGEILQVDTPEAIYQNPINQFVAGFIGSPSMNFVWGTITPCENKMLIAFENQEIELDGVVKTTIKQKGYHHADVVMGIRPEDFYTIRDYEEKFMKKPARNQMIQVAVSAREMLGAEVILYFLVGDKQFAARLGTGCIADVGDYVDLVIDISKIKIFDKDSRENILYHGERSDV